MKRSPPALVLILALIAPASGLLLTWHAAQVAPPGHTFLGFPVMPGDHYQYAAFIRQARETGGILMENPFTSEPQRPSYVLLYFWILGMVSRIGASIPAVWEAFRVLGGACAIVSFWLLTQRYLEDPVRRIMAVMIFTMAGGLDWCVVLLRATVVPAAAALEHPFATFWNWSFFGTLLVGHWVWPLVLLIAAGLALTGPAGPRRDIVTFLALPGIWFMHPYTGMVAWLTWGLMLILPVLGRGAARHAPGDMFPQRLRAVIPGLTSFLPVGAYLIWARGDEVFRLNSARGFEWTESFGIWWYPLTYGLLLPLALPGARRLVREGSARGDLVLAWCVAALALSLNPWFSGVKFQYLVFPPLALMASIGLFALEDGSARFRRLATRRVFVSALVIGLFLNAPVSLTLRMRSAPDPVHYAPDGLMQAMAWLDEQPQGIVLSGYFASNITPWLAGKKTFLGHWFMTLDAEEKRRDVSHFFWDEAGTPTRRAVLDRSGARWVVYGRDERRMGGIDPALPLRPAWRREGITIFEVAR